MATSARLPFLDGRPHLTIGINTADLSKLGDEVRAGHRLPGRAAGSRSFASSRRVVS